MTETEVREALEGWRSEREAIHVYGTLARSEPEPAASLFARLRDDADRQAGGWAESLAKAGTQVPEWRPGPRILLVSWLARTLGARRVLPVLAATKVRGLALYRGGPMPGSEAETLAPAPAEESWHRAAQGGGALRAAVFGVNDGLVSNASLILGVTGADPDPRFVVLAGVAGMLAGGFSMAAGEYVSVRTQAELLEHQLDLERAEMRAAPEEEIEELSHIYVAKGMRREDAESLARRIVGDPERGLETLAREELGLDPRAIASPWAAAVASFVSFAAGALLPLVPFLVSSGPRALLATIVATEAALLGVGALMSLFTGRSAAWSALRMALIGSAAGALTWLVGRMLGVSVG